MGCTLPPRAYRTGFSKSRQSGRQVVQAPGQLVEAVGLGEDHGLVSAIRVLAGRARHPPGESRVPRRPGAAAAGKAKDDRRVPIIPGQVQSAAHVAEVAWRGGLSPMTLNWDLPFA